MTRRELFSLLAATAARGEGFPGTPYHRYSRCLPDYLRGLAKHAAEKRQAAIARLVSPGAIEARQKWVQATLWKLIGGMPERTPLNATTTGSFERDGYRVDNIIYESRPELFISANLY